MWTEMTIQLEIKKKMKQNTSLSRISTYMKYITRVFNHWINKKSSTIRLIKKNIFQAIKIKYNVRTVSKSNIDITEKDKIDIPITQIHGLCSFFLPLLWICVLVVAFCFWPVAVFVLVYWCTRALIVMCNLSIQI
jgi:hypothetical protein